MSSTLILASEYGQSDNGELQNIDVAFHSGHIIEDNPGSRHQMERRLDAAEIKVRHFLTCLNGSCHSFERDSASFVIHATIPQRFRDRYEQMLLRSFGWEVSVQPC